MRGDPAEGRNKKNMSGFKRYQSKVFWGQMEARDLALTPPRSQFAPEREGDEESLSLTQEESLDAVESDTTDAENTTVIRIEMCESPVNR